MNGRDKGRRRPRGRNTERSNQTAQYGREGYVKDGKTRAEVPLRNLPPMPEKAGFSLRKQGWIAPVPNTDPLPVLICIRCGLPITDAHSALSEKNTGEPVHFDCAITELAEQEKLETGDVLSYIGGGRFGIVHFNYGRGDHKNFTIKKILEWEDKEKKAQWRDAIADRYSIT